MSLVPDGPWYRAILAAVEAQQAGIVDFVGRPWAQHFERVALRLLFRDPATPQPQIEAALLHDAMMDRGGGQAMLDRLGVSPPLRPRSFASPTRRPMPTITGTSSRSGRRSARCIWSTSAAWSHPATGWRPR